MFTFSPSYSITVPSFDIPSVVVTALADELNTDPLSTVTFFCSILPAFPSISVLSNLPSLINNSPSPFIMFALCASPLTDISNTPLFVIAPSFVYVSNKLCVINVAPVSIAIPVPVVTISPLFSNVPADTVTLL